MLINVIMFDFLVEGLQSVLEPNVCFSLPPKESSNLSILDLLLKGKCTSEKFDYIFMTTILIHMHNNILLHIVFVVRRFCVLLLY